jgi:hypothetical protein
MIPSGEKQILNGLVGEQVKIILKVAVILCERQQEPCSLREGATKKEEKVINELMLAFSSATISCLKCDNKQVSNY